MELTKNQVADFQKKLMGYYKEHARSLPWRESAEDDTHDGYKVLVSEIMLQQTQASRVMPKYSRFITAFPTLDSLASAKLSDVMSQWNGLGYNRRAKYLLEAARSLQTVGQPWSLADLVAQKGIGENTAKAVLVYTYNQPEFFIETNVRTVYIHHFFSGEEKVGDDAIAVLLEQTVDRQDPRVFYWALMDYGSHIKRTFGNASRRSSTHTNQLKFQGSKRQVRGQVIKYLVEGEYSAKELTNLIRDSRLDLVLQELVREGLIHQKKGLFLLPDA